jgi:hypothetical protein
MNGWRYEWVDALPQDVYEVLIEKMKEEAAKVQEQQD